MINKKCCDKCNKHISLSNYERHYNKCGIKKFNILDTYKQENGKYKCPYCQKEFTLRGINFHIWSIHNENRVWNTGKGVPSKLKGRKFKPRSKETKEKISKNNKGWMYGNRKCKWHEIIKVDGTKIKVQGTYEKRFAKILNILDEDWIKPDYLKDTLIWFDENNKKHTYYPDFWCPTLKKFFEVKGRYEEYDKMKMKYILSHYNNVEMIFLDDIKTYEKIFKIDKPASISALPITQARKCVR